LADDRQRQRHQHEIARTLAEGPPGGNAAFAALKQQTEGHLGHVAQRHAAAALSLAGS
jgi:hypothetical protein